MTSKMRGKKRKIRNDNGKRNEEKSGGGKKGKEGMTEETESFLVFFYLFDFSHHCISLRAYHKHTF